MLLPALWFFPACEPALDKSTDTDARETAETDADSADADSDTDADADADSDTDDSGGPLPETPMSMTGAQDVLDAYAAQFMPTIVSSWPSFGNDDCPLKVAGEGASYDMYGNCTDAAAREWSGEIHVGFTDNSSTIEFVDFSIFRNGEGVYIDGTLLYDGGQVGAEIYTLTATGLVIEGTGRGQVSGTSEFWPGERRLVRLEYVGWVEETDRNGEFDRHSLVGDVVRDESERLTFTGAWDERYDGPCLQPRRSGTINFVAAETLLFTYDLADDCDDCWSWEIGDGQAGELCYN